METVKQMNGGRVVSQHEVNEDGVPHGKYTSFWENGQVREEKNFEGGRVVGLVRQFGKDGNIEETQEYTDGERHGAYVMYHKGKKVVEQQYKMGILVRPRHVETALPVDNV
jgi:antitoxin component YwqK of YwqJK toxin-antitoxin module